MAGGTKRMSAEEKRKTILSIYHKTKTVYTEKEILTLASKAGVNSNTVADVNQSLVDDGLVDKEKIGGSNYYWSFPAKKDRQQQLQHEATVREIEKIKATVPGIEAALLDAKRGREEEEELLVEAPKEEEDDDDEKEQDGNIKAESAAAPPPAKKFKSTGRAATLARLAVLAKEKAEAEAEAAVLQENDPQALADLEKELQLTTQAANRWTDNIFNAKTYLVKKRGMDKKEACKIIGITSAFDYPEDKK